MAKAIAQRVWPDGDIVTFSVYVDDSFPDVVDEARVAAVAGFRDILGIAAAFDAAELEEALNAEDDEA